MGLFNCSLRVCMASIALLATLPAVAIIAYDGYEARNHALQDCDDQARNLANSLATLQTTVTGEARSLLTTLARLPAVIDRDEAVCDSLFARLLRDHPELSNILLTDLDGRVVATGLPLFKNTDVSDRKYFRDALATRAFSIGEFNIGRTSGRPILVFALPLLDADDRCRASWPHPSYWTSTRSS